jgi:hypothetical protein
VILVEGGSVVNLVAMWRVHGLPEVLGECWQAGVVLTGASARSLCWHVGGPTDSFRDSLDSRRAAFRELGANGKLLAGYATEDGVGLLYAGTEFLEAVTILPGRHAWHVTPEGNGSYAEEAIAPRLITAEDRSLEMLWPVPSTMTWRHCGAGPGCRPARGRCHLAPPGRRRQHADAGPVAA